MTHYNSTWIGSTMNIVESNDPTWSDEQAGFG